MALIKPHVPQVAVRLDNVPTYNYAVQAFAAVATPTDVVVIQGSATRRVLVKRVMLWGAATTAGTMPVQVIRRSTAGTLGSAVLTAVVPAKHDSHEPTATAVVSTVGTANYTTVGTTAGIIATGRLQMTALATGVAAFPFLVDFGNLQDKPIMLRGTSEFCNINFSAAAIPSGGVMDITIELEEDDGL
jgi:hypothetical protein